MKKYNIWLFLLFNLMTLIVTFLFYFIHKSNFSSFYSNDYFNGTFITLIIFVGLILIISNVTIGTTSEKKEKKKNIIQTSLYLLSCFFITIILLIPIISTSEIELIRDYNLEKEIELLEKYTNEKYVKKENEYYVTDGGIYELEFEKEKIEMTFKLGTAKKIIGVKKIYKITKDVIDINEVAD